MISEIHRVDPLHLACKPDAAEAQERMRAFWAGEMIDRPCVSVTVPRSGANPPPLPQVLAPDFDFVSAVDRFEQCVSGTFFGGEAMPALNPTWGPDTIAGFVGAELKLRPEEDTSWALPFVEDWDSIQSLSIDPDSRWWNAVLQLCRTAAERGRGKFLVCGLDMHTNADLLAAIRGPERLCMDLIDNPEPVLRHIKSTHALYADVLDAVFDATNGPELGSVSWLDMWSDGKTQSVECDFSALVSPEHFRKFILPTIEYEVSCLDDAVYHLDGVSSLPHLDDLLAIDRLKGIQWVQGAGEPPMTEWLDLLRKIQNAGKSIHISVAPDEMKSVHPHLAPEKTFYALWPVTTESEARELIHWLETHT